MDRLDCNTLDDRLDYDRHDCLRVDWNRPRNDRHYHDRLDYDKQNHGRLNCLWVDWNRHRNDRHYHDRLDHDKQDRGSWLVSGVQRHGNR